MQWRFCRTREKKTLNRHKKPLRKTRRERKNVVSASRYDREPKTEYRKGMRDRCVSDRDQRVMSGARALCFET